MDQKDDKQLSGWRSDYFFAQRGMHGSPGFQPPSNPDRPFQSNIGGTSTTVGSTLPVESSSAISPQAVDVWGLWAPSAQPQSEPAKRKRGRPRRYGIKGTVSLGIPPSDSEYARPTQKPRRGTISPTQKPRRGRPPGSGRKRQLAALGGSDGGAFKLHIITVAAGEDIAGKIRSFLQPGPRGIIILSANGAVSTVTLCQSCGTVTYEGHFSIMNLSGSYLLNHNGGSHYRHGKLAVALLSPVGHVFGGIIGGVLVAAINVQVTVGSFILKGSKTEDKEEEAPEGVRNLENQTVDNPVTPDSVQQSQNPTSTSSAERKGD